MSDDSQKVVRDLLPKGWSMDSTIDDETHKCVSVYRVKDDKEAAHTLWALSADASDKFNLPDRVFDRAKALADHRSPHVEGPTFCRKKTIDGVQWCVICSPEPPTSADSLELRAGRKADRKTAASIIHDVLIGLGALHKAFAGLDPPAHGGLRLNRVGLRNLWNSHHHATLLDAPVGPLSSWTKGEYLDGAEADGVRGTAWPTGAKDKVPTVENDIYAVGAMWAALLHVNLQRDKSWRKLDGATRFALKRMLADQADSRPSVARALDMAVAAIDANRKPTLWSALRRPFGYRLVRIITGFGLLLLASTGILGTCLWQADGDRENLERQAADLRVNNGRYLEERDNLQKSLSHAHAEIKRLEKSNNDLKKRIEAAKTDKRQSHLNGEKSKADKDKDNKGISTTQPVDKCKVVQIALNKWISYLKYKDIDVIRKSIDGISITGRGEKGQIQLVLKRWLWRATTGGVWNLRVGPARASYTRKWRNLWINVSKKPSLNYDWPDNKRDNRHPGPPVSVLGRGWKTGDTLDVLLEGVSGVWFKPNTNLIKVTINRPLAMYNLVYDGARQGDRFVHFDFANADAAFPLPAKWHTTWKESRWPYDFSSPRKKQDILNLGGQVRTTPPVAPDDPIKALEKEGIDTLGL